MPEKGTITIDGLIQEADKKLKQRAQVIEELAGTREMLRYLDRAGQTTPEQSKWIAEAFPPRERKAANANDGGE